MPFPERAWCLDAVAKFNDDRDAAAATEGWTFDVGLVVDGSVGLYLGPPVKGRLPEPMFGTVVELEARAPAYVARASAADWRALIDGSLDPIAAIVQKRLIAQGDLTPVVARLKFRGLAERWLARIQGA
jgi:hypothetical protein